MALDELYKQANKQQAGEIDYDFSIDTNGGGFFVYLLQAADQAHVWHLQTKSEPMHRALNTFYDAVRDFADSIAESLMSDKTIIQVPQDQAKVRNYAGPQEVQDYLNAVAYHAKVFKDSLEERPDIQNILDELIACVHKTKYLLTLS